MRNQFDRISSWLGLLGLMALLAPAPALADGQALAQRVYDRPNGRDATSVVTMTLQDRGRAPRHRTMLVYRLDGRAGEVSTLIRFLEPADIEGTGLLTLDRADGASNQWVYLPALDRVRRIDANRKGGRFVNSDYFFEDLRDRKVDQDRHRIIGRETLSGIDLEILESIPVAADNSVYSRRVSWIDPATALPMRIDFFTRDAATPSKRFQVQRRERVQGYWTIMDSLMIDLESGHQTRLLVQSIRYDRRLPARLFTTQALQDESMEMEFRP